MIIFKFDKSVDFGFSNFTSAFTMWFLSAEFSLKMTKMDCSPSKEIGILVVPSSLFFQTATFMILPVSAFQISGCLSFILNFATISLLSFLVLATK